MKKVIEKELADDITVWGMGDVSHTPKIYSISLNESDGWYIGQKVTITIESEDALCHGCDKPGTDVKEYFYSFGGKMIFKWWFHEECFNKHIRIVKESASPEALARFSCGEVEE